MKISIRADYADIDPNNELFLHIKEIELAFHFRDEFFSVDPNALISSIHDLDLIVNSIHGPALQLKKPEVFIKGLKKCILFCKRLECNVIVIHPSYVNSREKSITFIKNGITPLLKKHDILLAWENFPGKRRIANNIHEIANLLEEINGYDYHRICLDTSHSVLDTDNLLKIMLEYRDLISVYHLSNWTPDQQHLPLFSNGKIDFNTILKPRNFNQDAMITLEYLDQYHEYLIKDYFETKKRLVREL